MFRDTICSGTLYVQGHYMFRDTNMYRDSFHSSITANYSMKLLL